MTDPKMIPTILESYADKRAEWVFNNILNWNTASKSTQMMINGTRVTANIVRELAGFKLIKVEVDQPLGIVAIRELDKKLGKLAPERLAFVESRTEIQWIWPKRLSSGSSAVEISTHTIDSMPLYMAQRLAGLYFSEAEIRSGLTIGIVSARVRGQFDTSQVTRKFYNEFREKHSRLADSIKGVSNKAIRQEYASTLLNRLMFLYFLQKKQFLNGDLNYLNNALKKLRSLKKQNNFYNFYQHLLTVLFFEKLAKPNSVIEDEAISEIIGDIRYINGGIFERNTVEVEFSIEIPDAIFEELFNFFDSYVWHLDTRATGVHNEINPEVIGYIFEQYINAETTTGQKENGAYYTPHDVSSYMTEYTLGTRYLDKMIELGFDPLKIIDKNPMAYIKIDNLRGYDEDSKTWLPLPDGIPKGVAAIASWKTDEVPGDPNLQLPGENWIQTIQRRRQTQATMEFLSSSKRNTVGDLVTFNLDCIALIRDFHHSLQYADDVEKLWNALTSISVIDPTCGSGAFLFAALEHLETFYGSLMDVAREGRLSKLEFAVQAKSHPNEKYFIRKHAAINNLYGTDLMAGAIETAKLRVFLSLAACLENVDQLEPLPDMDLNLKCGNLVIGIYDQEDVLKLAEADITFLNAANEIELKLDEMKELYSQFVLETQHVNPNSNSTKIAFKATAAQLNELVNETYFQSHAKGLLSKEEWLADRKPLHWFIEFPNIVSAGGFDVVVGNPPYISMKRNCPFDEYQKSEFSHYRTSELPDFYAICYERSLQILAQNGRHAFIVMLSLGFSKTFRELVEIIGQESSGQWWSTYGKDPSGLFAGVKVRNTILILARDGQVHQTNHKIISSPERQNLFPTMKYFVTGRDPKKRLIRAGTLEPLVSKILSRPRTENRESGEALHVKVTAAYWFPVMYYPPHVLNKDYSISTKPARTDDLKLRIGEDKKLAFALLGSRIGYLIWAAIGDDFDSDAAQGAEMLGIIPDLYENKDLRELAENILVKAHEAVYVNHQLGGYYPNIRWSMIVEHTRPFEYKVLDLLGMSHLKDDLEFWYNQAMKSTRPSSNNVFLSSKEAKKYLGWG